MLVFEVVEQISAVTVLFIHYLFANLACCNLLLCVRLFNPFMPSVANSRRTVSVQTAAEITHVILQCRFVHIQKNHRNLLQALVSGRTGRSGNTNPNI